MADQDRTDDQDVDQNVMEGGIEHVIHDVEVGEEIPGDHPDQAYQFRQRIVDPDKAAELMSAQEEPASSEPPPPLPPAESP